MKKNKNKSDIKFLLNQNFLHTIDKILSLISNNKLNHFEESFNLLKYIVIELNNKLKILKIYEIGEIIHILNNIEEWYYKNKHQKNTSQMMHMINSLNQYIYNIKNILSRQKSNDEYFTSEETVFQLSLLLNLPKNIIIWCPFDTEESEFVKYFKSNGYKVIYSHIKNGQDFYNYQPNKKWDIIISNPPFSNKRLLIERCEQLNKPFILLYGATICSQSMGNTLNRCFLWFIQKSCTFTLNDKSTKSFQCVWVMSKTFPYLNIKYINHLLSYKTGIS